MTAVPRPRGGTLFVDDALPRQALGAGHPRGLEVLRVLAGASREVLVVASMGRLGHELPADALPGNVRVAEGSPLDALASALAGPRRAFDLLWVNRPNNMALVDELHRRRPALFEGMRIVYYAESIFAMREVARQALLGRPVSDSRAQRWIRAELFPAEIAHAVAAATPSDRDIVARHLRCPVDVVGYPARLVPGEPAFGARNGVLFVGALSPADSPNGDSVRFLLGSIWPELGSAAPRLAIAGRGSESGGWLAPFASPHAVDLVGVIADLAPVFDRARVFVAPTRYASGVPMKVLDAARHGVPVVATSLLAKQLGWRDGEEILVADTAQDFARAVARLHDDEALWMRIRASALDALARDGNPETFAERILCLALASGRWEESALAQEQPGDCSDHLDDDAHRRAHVEKGGG